MTIQLVGTALVAVALGVGTPAQEVTQRTSGVYLTAADYQNGRLTDEGDCTSASHKIELHDLLGKSSIHVTHESERRQYAKSALFGVRACDGRDYRFMANREYRILEARDLYIYVRREVQAVTGPRGLSRPIDTYYFSAGASGEVVPLTVENLKRAFPDNHRFHDSLDVMRGDLAQYDEFHKMFKVNRLLIASKST